VTAPLDIARAALAEEEAWLVGGAVRDRLLGRETIDVDVALAGDPRRAARRVAKAAGGSAFELSGAFGAWRAVGPDHAWHVDLVPLRDGDVAADLAARDFTINAMAQPLAGGETVDPHGGREDLAARRLRMVSAEALRADPLRTLRAVRLAVELGLEIEPATARAVAAEAPGIERVAPERVFAELKRIVGAPAVRRGLGLMKAHGCWPPSCRSSTGCAASARTSSITPTSGSTRSRCSMPSWRWRTTRPRSAWASWRNRSAPSWRSRWPTS